jgi:putative membrane protein
MNAVLRFIAFWLLNTLVLWVADYLFDSMSFTSTTSLLVSGLVFGIAHAVLKPLLVLLTLPITLLTLGLFVLIINAVILLLVAWVVPGFTVTGFWNAVGVALFISIFSFLLNLLLRER